MTLIEHKYSCLYLGIVARLQLKLEITLLEIRLVGKFSWQHGGVGKFKVGKFGPKKVQLKLKVTD